MLYTKHGTHNHYKKFLLRLKKQSPYAIIWLCFFNLNGNFSGLLRLKALYDQFMADIFFKFTPLYELPRPDKSTNGQFGCFSMASILFIPMLLYSAASFIVSVILRWIGMCASGCTHIGVTAPLQWRSHVKFRSLSLIVVFPPVRDIRRWSFRYVTCQTVGSEPAPREFHPNWRSVRAALIVCDGFITLELWLNGSIIMLFAGHSGTGSCPVF